MLRVTKFAQFGFLFLLAANAYGGWNPILTIEAPNATGWLDANSTMSANAMKVVKNGPGCQNTLVEYGATYSAQGNSYYFNVQSANRQSNPKFYYLYPTAQIERIHITTIKSSGLPCTYTFYEHTLEDDLSGLVFGNPETDESAPSASH